MNKLLLTFFMLLLICSTAWAQTRKITGKVTDAQGPLVGVSVKVKGAALASSTNGSGVYTLQIPKSGDIVLVFTYIGFITKEVSVGTNSNLDVILQDDNKGLNEVVVVGYGTQKRGDVTGAISSVSGKDIEANPVSSVIEALTGRVPGLQITTGDGTPGGSVLVRLRGGGSITQDNTPLYIVDGFPVADLSNIAPTDIASVDVLKDAASTAIYGAQGANGVIIVTTKTPKAGRTVVSYNGYGQLKTFPRELEVLSPYEFVLAQYEFARVRSQASVDDFSKYFGVYGDLELYKNKKATNWQKNLFGNSMATQQHNLSISGGTDKTKLNFTASDNKDQGLQVGSNFERIYLNLKLNHAISNKLTLDLVSRFSNTITNGAGTSGVSQVKVSDGITTRPVNGLADFINLDPGQVGGNDQDFEAFIKSTVNPNDLAAQDYRKRLSKVFTFQGALSWKINNALTFRSEGGMDMNFADNKRYFGPLTSTSRNEGQNLPLGEITLIQGKTLRIANTLNYNFIVGKEHSFSVLGGQELRSIQSRNNYNRAKGFDVQLAPEKLFANFALGTADQMTSYVDPDDNMTSFFGRINYKFKDKYLLTLTSRADASSKFAPGKQWGFFPAAAAAWRISEEPFMKNITVVSDLKLRLSYGAVGNNRIPNDLWHAVYKLGVSRPIGFGDVPQPYYQPSSNLLPNPDLKWETTITQNVGLDFSLFKGKLSGTLDVYSNYTKDLLVISDIPSFTGYPSQMRNIGRTSNRGVELGLSGTIINKNGFTLTGVFNVAMNRSKVDKLDGVATEIVTNSGWASTDLKFRDDYRVRVGQTLGLIYGFVSDGMYSVDDFASYTASTGKYTLKPGIADGSSVTGGIGIRPGIAKLKDLNGDGAITLDDRQVIGHTLPKATGGFGLNAGYMGFDLATFFTWSYGNDVYNTGKIAFNMYYRTTYGNMLNTSNYESRYHYIDAAGNLVTDLEALRALNPNPKIASPFSYGNASPVVSTLAVEDGSFLRLSNVTLGYTLPIKLTKRFGVSKLRVYGTVYNALLFTKYSGYDPEVSTPPSGNSDSYNNLTPGVDFSGYPKSRTYTFGLNLSF